MSSFYGTVKHGDEISPGWMQNVEDGLGSGTPAQLLSYVIWTTDATTFYARNGLTGERESDDNLGNLINEKILELYDAGSGPGGVIGIKPYGPEAALTGRLPLTTTINMRPEVYLEGLGWNTLLMAESDICMVKYDPPTNITAGSQGYYGGLSNLILSGYGQVTTQAIVDINPSTNRGWGDITFDHVGMLYGKYGLRVNNNTTSAQIWNIFAHHSQFEQNTYNGVLIDSPTNQPTYQFRFTACHFFNNNTSGGNGAFEVDGHDTYLGFIGAGTTFKLEKRNAIYMLDEADNWSINGVTIADAGELTTNTYSGIKLVDVDHISVVGNSAVNRANNKMKYGFESDNSCTYLSVFGNTLKGQSGGGSQGTDASNRPLTADFTDMNACETG